MIGCRLCRGPTCSENLARLEIFGVVSWGAGGEDLRGRGSLSKRLAPTPLIIPYPSSMPAAVNLKYQRSQRPTATTNGSGSTSNGVKPFSGSSRRVDDDFIMTLDSDDEGEGEAVGQSEAESSSQQPDESAGEAESGPSRKQKSTAGLGKGEKIIDGKGKGRAPATGPPPGEELALDKGFSFDVDEDDVSRHNGWDFNVANGSAGGKKDKSVTVDDIIESKRARRGDLGLPTVDSDEEGSDASQEEDDEEEDDAEEQWGGFSDEDAQAQDAQDSESDEDDEAFGAGVKPEHALSGSDDDDNDEAEKDSESDDASDDDEEQEEDEASADSGSDSESDEETEVQKARKAAFFASESEKGSKRASTSASAATPDSIASFQSFSLSRPLLRGLADLSFATPTPIQSRTIPIALAGKDIVAGAQTGSGKTAAFMIPILERLAHRPRGAAEAKTRVVVLTPTRELAVQCWNVGKALGKYSDVRFCLAVGGLSLKSQEQELKMRPEIVIATPGRLIDHMRNSASFGIEDIEILVMDEADRMLEDGFADELNEIIQSTPKSRQTMLFSATMTDDVDELVRLSLKRPVRLFVDPKRTTASNLIQEFVRVRGSTTGAESSSVSNKRTEDEARPALLLSLCVRTFRHQVIIFVRSKKLAHQLKILFGLMGLAAAELHGDLSQEQRLASLQSFKEGKVDFLLATDLASRGLDIKGVQTVINYDMPAQFEIYIHRVGRTARAGKNGRSVTLVGEGDRRLLKTVLKKSPPSQIKHRLIPHEIVSSIHEKISLLKSDVEEVMSEEKEEKALRQAEMELTKGQNMLEHRDEIMSRPKRTWFQTEKEKEASKNLSAKEYAVKVDAAKASEKRKDDRKHDKWSGLSRKQKRIKMAREEIEAEGGQGAIDAGIRSAKKKERPSELGVMDSLKLGRNSKAGADKKKKNKKSRSSTAALKVGKKGGGFKRDLTQRSSSGGASSSPGKPKAKGPPGGKPGKKGGKGGRR